MLNFWAWADNRPWTLYLRESSIAWQRARTELALSLLCKIIWRNWRHLTRHNYTIFLKSQQITEIYAKSSQNLQNKFVNFCNSMTRTGRKYKIISVYFVPELEEIWYSWRGKVQNDGHSIDISKLLQIMKNRNWAFQPPRVNRVFRSLKNSNWCRWHPICIVFWTHLSVFGHVVKHSLSCLIYNVK